MVVGALEWSWVGLEGVRSGAAVYFRAGLWEQRWELNAADWRPCTGNHEQQQRVWELPAGPHTGVSPAGLCAQQDGEDRGSGGEQRRENRYEMYGGFIMQENEI